MAKNEITRGPNRKLTRRQEKFVKELVANDGLVTLREAAIRAGYSSSSAHSRAFELTSERHCPHVVAEIRRYRMELDEQYGVTFKRHVRDLQKIRDAAMEDKSYSAAVMAETRRGLAEGLYVSKSEIRTGSIDAMSRADVEKELERIRESYQPTIDITPQEIHEPDTDRGAEEQGSGSVEDHQRRIDEDGPED
jgi:phage terminase small subunit